MLRSESACAAGLIAMSADQYHTLALTPFGRDDATNALVPAAESLYRKRLAADSGDDPIAHCQPPGSPRILSPKPTKIIEDPFPTWMGYSIGRWDPEWMSGTWTST